MSKIRFENIDKIYDNGFQAVYDFNLEIQSGEFIVFVGPSGCGKSTMIRIIAGLEAITKGKIFFDDICVNTKSPNARGIAMVFQSYALYPHLNVAENMGFALKLEGYDEDYIEERVKKTAAILGLSNYLERKPRELSGGQCQRVAVGRAIIREPKVFLMDEPLSNLDAKQRVTMRSEIIEIHRRTKATTIYVTHDQVEAMTMADRIIVMRDGRIQQVGTPHELYFAPQNKFVAGFIGDPPMNFIDCSVCENKIVLSQATNTEPKMDLTLDIGAAYPNALKTRQEKQLVFGFRPEAIVLGDDAQNGVVIKAVAEVSELLGDVANIYAYVGQHRIILRVAPHQIPKEGEQISFVVPYESIYLFEGENAVTVVDK